MSAIQDAIRVSGIFYIATAQSAFISALVKFAQIGSKEVLNEKNIEAIIVLLEIGQSDGNYLGEYWPVVCFICYLFLFSFSFFAYFWLYFIADTISLLFPFFWSTHSPNR